MTPKWSAVAVIRSFTCQVNRIWRVCLAKTSYECLGKKSFIITLVQIRIWDFEAKKAEHLIA